MSETNKTLQQVITPFADMDEVCKALFLVKTFSVHGYAFCLNKLNASLNRDIDMRHFELFLERIKIFSTFFPVKFLNDMEKMQSSYMPEINEVFRPSISQCLLYAQLIISTKLIYFLSTFTNFIPRFVFVGADGSVELKEIAKSIYS